MAAQTYTITFQGYCREENKGSVPSKSGIYCVYRCTYDESVKAVSLKELIYIGEADDIKDRLAYHEKLSDWKGRLKQGEQLCYSFGGVEPRSRERCEAAMVFWHEPPENIEFKNAFPFDETTMNLSGKTAHLDTNFTVQRTP